MSIPVAPRGSGTNHATRRFLAVAIGASCVAGLAFAVGFAVPVMATTSGVAVYQARSNNVGVDLGSQANATTVLTKKVPAGKYLVHGQIGVNTQPGSFIVCALSNTLNGNDGIFGVFTNQWTFGAQENVSEDEVLKIAAGQSIHLTCADNNGKAGDTVGDAVIEAIPANAVR